MAGMTIPPPEVPRDADERRPKLRPEASLFARIEGLIGEEDAILRIPAHERRQEQHDRLREVADELDRIFEKLRDRAERLARRPAQSGS
jgi:hypothetical protein